MYIGNNLQVANPSYKIIDDISSGFNGSTTSFALQVSGETPVPFPINTQQVMISVNGVVQEPDPSGSAGFKLLGSNIVFSSAPANGHAFFGTILAGADYVTAGSEFPDGSVTAPSFTFEADQDSGWYRIGSGSVGYSANGVQTLNFDGNGLTIASGKKLITPTAAISSAAYAGGGASPELYVKGTGGRTVKVHNPNSATASIQLTNATTGEGEDAGFQLAQLSGGDMYFDHHLAAKDIVFRTRPSGGSVTERLRLDSGGRLLLGTSATGPSGSYNNNLIVYEDGDTGISIRGKDSNSNYATLSLGDTTAASRGYLEAQLGTNGNFTIGSTGTGAMRFLNNGTEKMRLDSNGRLLIGQTSADTDMGSALQISGTSYAASGILQARTSADQYGPAIDFLKSRNTTWNSHTIVQDDDQLGRIYFRGDDGTDYGSGGAAIIGSVDGTPGADDMPARLTFHTSADGSVSLTERMRIDSSGVVRVGGTDTYNASDKMTLVGSGNTSLTIDATSSTEASVFFADGATGNEAYRGYVQYKNANDSLVLGTAATLALTLDSSQNATFAGTVSDSKGDLRNIISSSKSSAYTLVASDNGKCIITTTGAGGTVTIPNSVMSTSNAVSIINNSSGDISIVQGSGLTLYNTADGTTGTKTLAGRGMCTIWFASASIGYLSGAGLS